MLEKFDFSDINKFVVSLGVVLFALAFAFPWVFIDSVIDFQVSQADYNALTAASKTLVNQKEKTITITLRYLPLISAVLMSSGLIIFTLGIKKWSRKQREINDTLDYMQLEMGKINLQKLMKSMSSEEKMDAMKEEIDSSAGSAVSETIFGDANTTITRRPEIDTTSNIKANPPETERQNKIVTALKAEDLVYEEIMDKNPFEYKVERNLRIGQYKIDILMKSALKNKNDHLIEIRYYDSPNQFSSVYSTLDTLMKFRTFYVKQFIRKATGHLIVVFDQKQLKGDIVGKFITSVDAFRSERGMDSILFHLVAISELESHNFNLRID